MKTPIRVVETAVGWDLEQEDEEVLHYRLEVDALAFGSALSGVLRCGLVVKNLKGKSKKLTDSGRWKAIDTGSGRAAKSPEVTIVRSRPGLTTHFPARSARSA